MPQSSTSPTRVSALETLPIQTAVDPDLAAKTAEESVGSLEEPELRSLSALMTAAHDLKSMVAKIAGRTEALLDENESGALNLSQRKELRSIQALCRQMRRVVEDCYSYGLLETGEMQLTMVPNDFAAAVREVYEIWQTSARRRRLELHLEAGADSFVFAFDQAKVQRIVSNLLENAMKYTPAGGHIRVKWEAEFWERRNRVENPKGPERRNLFVGHPNAVKLTVSDTGCGIPVEDQQAVFEPFVRLHGRDHDGLGLGLAITRRLVHWHGGKIWVESAPSAGSKFCILFPRREKRAD